MSAPVGRCNRCRPPTATDTSGTNQSLVHHPSRHEYTGNGCTHRYSYTYDSAVVEVLDAEDQVVNTTNYGFNENGQTTSSTCGGCASSVEYDDPANPYLPTKVVAADGKETTYTYDAHGNLLTTTDPRGVTITNTWDYTAFALGRLTKVERTVDQDTITLAEYTYHATTGQVLTAKALQPGTTAGALVTTTYTYDTLGNVLTVTAPGNNAASTITTTYEYETDGTYSQDAAVGQPLYVEDNLGHQTHFRYDARGNRTTVTDALGHTWHTAYNLADQVVFTEQPATGQQGAGQATVQYDYLFVGGPRTNVTVLDESGVVVQHINYHLGLEGELLEVSGGTEPVAYTYDALYRQISLTDGNDHTTLFAYDSKGRLSLIRYPLATADQGYDTVRFTLYDDAGRLLRRIDGRDLVTDYDYDATTGDLLSIEYPAYPAQNVAFTYDDLGRRTAMTDATGTHAYTYDDGGTLLSHTVTYTGLAAKTVSYTYYPNGSRATLTTPASTSEYAYDAAGRLVELEYGLGTAAWEYLDNGLLAQQTLPNGCYSEYAYNAANQLVGLANKSASDAILTQYGDLLHAGTGDLTAFASTVPGQSSLTGDTTFGYDRKRQLTQQVNTQQGGRTWDYVYDPAGNATSFDSTTRTYNADNQLTGPETYVYDGNGNPTTWQGTSLTFDVENRMTAYGTTLTAGYRGDGLRAWKETANGRRHFLYDGITVVAELDAEGDLVGTLTHGATGLLSYNATQYQMNPLGDVAVRLDGNGTVLSYPLFDAWGNPLTASTGEPCGYKARYGYYTDGETGLVALAYRYYAPGVGRFLNRDPIGYGGGVGLYSFCTNSPVLSQDAAGTSCRHDCEEQWQHCAALAAVAALLPYLAAVVICYWQRSKLCLVLPPGLLATACMLVQMGICLHRCMPIYVASLAASMALCDYDRLQCTSRCPPETC